VLVAREQVEGGAHVLDVCTALTERADEDAQMATIVKKLAQSVEAPLMIDSTEAARDRKAALKIYAGRAIVNSINLENGRKRIDDVMPLVREAGAAVVALTIDETGMAKTRRAQARDRAAHPRHRHDRVRFAAGRADLRRADLHAGDRRCGVLDSAVETIEGIRLIKRELPGVLTSLGVSNVSFGLKPAQRARRAQLGDAASLRRGRARHGARHAKEITPYAEIDALERELCDDLVFNRRPDALQRVIEHWESKRAARPPPRPPTTTPTSRSRCAFTTRSCAAAKTASKRSSTRCWRARSGRRAQQRAAAGDERGRRQVRTRAS
jgi:5-methyltetrahydrofolate--homocysteine methyltransferase